MVERALRAGTLLPCEALIDGSGQPSADPNCIGAGGAIAPMGGAHWGHKGFALALLNETLTGCLAGFGRARATQDGVPAGSACLLQLIDPEGFAGRAAFLAEMEALVRAVKSAPAAGGSSGPRLPGERAFALRRRQLREGVTLHPDVPPLLEELARHYGIPPPPRSPGGAQRASWTRQRGNPAA
jgi:LDH2 family malate/lactate/ureidoglycolate dehydrogenase